MALPHRRLHVAGKTVSGVFRAKLAGGPFAMPLFKFAADVHTLSRRAELQGVTQDYNTHGHSPTLENP